GSDARAAWCPSRYPTPRPRWPSDPGSLHVPHDGCVPIHGFWRPRRARSNRRVCRQPRHRSLPWDSSRKERAAARAAATEMSLVVVDVLAGRPVRVGVTHRLRPGCPFGLLLVLLPGLGQQLLDVLRVLLHLVEHEGQSGCVANTGLPTDLATNHTLGALERGSGRRLLLRFTEHRVVHRGITKIRGDPGVGHGDEPKTGVLDPPVEHLGDDALDTVGKLAHTCGVNHRQSSSSLKSRCLADNNSSSGRSATKRSQVSIWTRTCAAVDATTATPILVLRCRSCSPTSATETVNLRRSSEMTGRTRERFCLSEWTSPRRTSRVSAPTYT